jgi:PPIC-type PPIASE domain
MIRNFLFVCALTVAPLLAQQATPPTQSSQPPAAVPGGTRPQPVQPAVPVAPDTPVVTVHGICPPGKTTGAEKSDSCTLVLTRMQFETLVSSINTTNQPYATPALRGFATGYGTLLALAEAGEKAGVDKEPRFQELIKIARTRALADSYRRFLQEKYGNPSNEEIEQYYKQNISKYEQMKIERIQIPKVNPKRPQERRPEFEKKARELAAEIRERAAKGEDMAALQLEAYNSLGLGIQPPSTEMATSPKPMFPPNVEQDINALKPGEVTKVEFELSGFNIYKLRSRNTVPLEQARAQLVREISQKNINAALSAATSGVHSDLNEQYFNPHVTSAPQLPKVPARLLPPGGMQSVRPVAPVAAPAPSGSPAPAANSGSSPAQKPAPPK